MDVPRELAVCAVRFSMGRTTTAAEVETVIAALREAIPVATALGIGALAAAGPGTSA
jgi:cysteine sulfinate desulfinase/cysteine desulfurase-like protein